MNFSEFIKLIGADPRGREPETMRARNSSPEFKAAAEEAEVFEEKLTSALQIQAPDDLLKDIKSISRQPVRKRNWMPLAMAASLLVAIGAVGMAWKQSRQWDSIEAYLADHYSHDGSALIAEANGSVSEQEINRLLARFNAEAGQPLTNSIQIIKYCPTPDGKGAHMVVNTDQGAMTVIFMPETQVTDGETVQFDQMHALLVNLGRGSAAIIGDQSQSVDNIELLLRQSLKTDLVGA